MSRLAPVCFAVTAITFTLPLLPGCRKPPTAAEEEVWIAPVKVAPARALSLAEWTELIGATQPLPGRAARVTAPVEGHVLSILQDEHGQPVAEGQKVKKGEVIVRLDDRVARAQRDKMVAALAELTESRKQADVAYQLAVLDVDRLTKLYPPGTSDADRPLISRVEIEQARLRQQDAESKQRAVGAKEKTLRAELNALEVQLGYYALRTPIAGTLGPVQVVPGQTLSVGTAVADVTDLSELDVVAFAPPHATRKLNVGQPARYAGKGADQPNGNGPEGKIVFLAIQAQPDTGNFQVKVRFDNASAQLRANQVVRVLAQTQPLRECQTIPTAALMEDQDPPLVVVATDVEAKKSAEGKTEHLGKARRLRAYLGIRDRDRQVVEVVRLHDPVSKADVPIAGIQFIVDGGHGLHDGDLIRVESKNEKEGAGD